MKHAGSNEMLSAAATTPRAPAVRPHHLGPASQSPASRWVPAAGCLLLIALVADAPLRDLARTLDPSAQAVLRVVTEFGNSAWPLGIGLFLLGLIQGLRRCDPLLVSDELRAVRSMLVCVVASVAISGLLASLSKHVIGRMRPSTEPEAMVLDFSVMAFKTGWASFPSGHATTAAATAAALALCFPRHAWAWATVGALAALSRALLGVHWLTDSLAGIVLGTVVAREVHRRMTAAGHDLKPRPGAVVRSAAGCAVTLRRLAVRATRRS
ncbi:MAG: phosphatase PAP2 family protein [Pseudomonadota bacterium]